MVNESVNGVAVVSDEGQRMAWQFDKTVIEKLKGFKPGDPVVVIYRQRGSDKAVTAIAFPGAAATPIYVNTIGQRVELVSGPMVSGACGQTADTPGQPDDDPDRRPGRDRRTPAGAARPRARPACLRTGRGWGRPSSSTATSERLTRLAGSGSCNRNLPGCYFRRGRARVHCRAVGRSCLRASQERSGT